MVPLGGSPHAWLLGGLGLAGLGLYLWLNWTPGVPIPSAATAPGAATTESVPGGRQTPEYARLQELANRDRAERARASGGYGPAYVRAELANLHGLSAGVIAAAMDGFEGDWLALARDLARRRHPQAFSGAVTARRNALDFLLRRGFSMDQARAALAQSPP